MTEGVFAHWPNRITAVRFVGAAALFALFAVDHAAAGRGEASAAWFGPLVFWLFTVLAATDFLDGWLARRGNHVTTFGRIADPFVDKVLVMGSMVFLAVMDRTAEWFPAWIVVVILAREFLVTGIRGFAESQGIEFPADWFGKIKMFAQCLAIGDVLLLFAHDWSDGVRDALALGGHVLVWATLVTSVGSGVSYLLKLRSGMRRVSR